MSGLAIRPGVGEEGLKVDLKHLSPEELDKAFKAGEAQKSKLYELRSGYTAAEKADESEADSTIEQAFNTLEAQPSIKSTIVDPKATDVVAQAKVAVNNGNPAGFDFEKMFGDYGNKLKEFFKSIFGPILNAIKGLSMRFGSPEKKDEILTKLVKENKDGKILESYGAKTTEGNDKSTIVQFEKDAKIVGTKKTEAPKDAQGNTINNELSRTDSIKINDGKIIVEKDSKITTVKEVSGGIMLTIKNKDGTTDTYTVANIKKIEPQK